MPLILSLVYSTVMQYHCYTQQFKNLFTFIKPYFSEKGTYLYILFTFPACPKDSLSGSFYCNAIPLLHTAIQESLYTYNDNFSEKPITGNEDVSALFGINVYGRL